MIVSTDTVALSGNLSGMNPVATPLLLGSRYQELAEINRGGCGVVSRVFDQHLQCDVALKRILPELAHDAAVKQRFLHEARVTARLTHPGIAPIHDLNEDVARGGPYYTMKWLHGQTLAEALERHHALCEGRPKQRSLRELLIRFRYVCQTLAYAHQQGIVHRDLKPANILIGQFGETIVLDWGLAKVIKPADVAEVAERTDNAAQPAVCHQPYVDSKVDLTRAGAVIGTVAYMSPEQAAGQAQRVDPRADVFALGIILYEMLAGTAPFLCPTDQETLQHILRSEYRPLRQLNRRIPRALAAICHRALMREPDKRYADAGEMEHDLRAWLAGDTVAAYQEPWWHLMDRLASKHRTLFWSILLSLVAISIIFIVSTVAVSLAHHDEKEARLASQAAHAQLTEAFQREKLAHQEAVTQLQQARGSIDGWLLGLDSVLALYPGLASVRNQLFHQAIDYYSILANQEPQSALMALEVVRAKIRLADLQHHNGHPQDALTNYQQSLEQLDSMQHWPTDWQPVADLQRAEALLGLSRLEFAKPPSANEPPQKSQFQSGPNAIQVALDICQQHIALPVVSEQAFELLARAWHLQALSWRKQKDFSQALRAVGQAISIYETHINPLDLSQTNTQQRQAYLAILNDQATIFIEVHDYASATDTLQHMIHVYDRLLEIDAARADWLEGRALARLRCGWCHTQMVHPHASVMQLEASEDDLQNAWHLLKGEQSFFDKLSQIHQALGHSYFISGDFEQAYQLLDRSLADVGPGLQLAEPDAQLRWLETQLYLMTIQLRQGRPVNINLQAIEEVLKKLALTSGQVPGLSKLHAQYYGLKAQIQSRARQSDQALKTISGAIEWQMLQSEATRDAAWHFWLGRLYWQQKLIATQAEDVDQYLHAACQHWQLAYDTNDPRWSTHAALDLFEAWVQAEVDAQTMQTALNMAHDIVSDHEMLPSAWFWLAELAFWHGDRSLAEHALMKLKRLRRVPSLEDQLLSALIHGEAALTKELEATFANEPVMILGMKSAAELLAIQCVPGSHAAWLQSQLRSRQASSMHQPSTVKQ